jgi:hypothetical protein
LDEDNEWMPIAVPYYKFFNFGEPCAASIDWNSKVTVQEKLDGSLATLYL